MTSLPKDEKAQPRYTFKVAENAGDYRGIRRLVREAEFPDVRASFPTVMAFEDKKLVGALCTDTSQDMVVAGPLVMKADRRRPMLALRLCEQYEHSLRNLGIVSYIMAVQRGSLLHKAIERYTPEMQPYASEGGQDFYVRRL